MEFRSGSMPLLVNHLAAEIRIECAASHGMPATASFAAATCDTVAAIPHPALLSISSSRSRTPDARSDSMIGRMLAAKDAAPTVYTLRPSAAASAALLRLPSCAPLGPYALPALIGFAPRSTTSHRSVSTDFQSSLGTFGPALSLITIACPRRRCRL
jgi:hypothetical protein